ncbi:MAG: uracil-DNA glycosylase [Gemmatimonadota bacterium]
MAVLKARSRALAALEREIAACRRCPRLVEWREEVSREKRAAYRDEVYWGRGVPGFGDPAARLLIVGLAPGAHGANRTGRMFTGDRSGEWLYRALHRAGFANQAASERRGDGLLVADAYIAAAVRCVPPGNRPEAREQAACSTFLSREMGLLGDVKVVVTLGGVAFARTWSVLKERAVAFPTPRPRFTHGLELPLPDGRTLLGCYHPSQQNTFTGRLTEPMFDAVWSRARALVDAAVDEP